MSACSLTCAATCRLLVSGSPVSKQRLPHCCAGFRMLLLEIKSQRPQELCLIAGCSCCLSLEHRSWPDPQS